MPSLSTDITQQIEKAVAILKKGGLVAFPTDTVYGLGAIVSNLSAVRRIYEVKARPLSRALPLLLAGASQADEVAVDISATARLLMQHFWPGALTLVLKKASWIPAIVTGGGDTVALRVPNHEVALALVKGAGMPLVGTSANLSGQPSPLTAEGVKAQLGGKIDLIIDGSPAPLGMESTIIDVSVEPLRLIRERAIPRAEIEKYVRLV